MEWKQWLFDRQSKLREEDTDWNRWLLGKPYRPFDPHVYLEFRLYKDYSSGRIQGRDGTIANYGGEGASLFTVSKEGGRNEYDSSADVTKVPAVAPVSDQEEIVQVAGAEPPNARGPGDDSVVHLMNWLKSMQSRTEPNANVNHGFSHSIVTIMAAQSYWSGKKLYWNPQTEDIVDQPITASS